MSAERPRIFQEISPRPLRANRDGRTATTSLCELPSGTRFGPLCFPVRFPGHIVRELLRFVGRHGQPRFEQTIDEEKLGLPFDRPRSGVETPATVAAS